MKLTDLTGPAAAPGPARSGPPLLADPEIVGLTADSRQVKPGFLFAALRGTSQDGRAFAGDAVASGAVAILTDDPAALALDDDARRRVAVIADANPARCLALLAARFYRRQPATVVAVTGHQRQDLGRPFHARDLDRDRRSGGKPRHARPRIAARPPRRGTDDA